MGKDDIALLLSALGVLLSAGVGLALLLVLCLAAGLAMGRTAR